MQVNGIQYAPAFVTDATTDLPVQIATAYINDNISDTGKRLVITEGLPKLYVTKPELAELTTDGTGENQKAYINYLEKDKQMQEVTSDFYTTADDKQKCVPPYLNDDDLAKGIVTPEHMTVSFFSGGNHRHDVPRVRIKATITSAENPNMTYTTEYWARICRLIAYVVKDGETPAARDTRNLVVEETSTKTGTDDDGNPITSTTKTQRTLATMTYGGWLGANDGISYDLSNSYKVGQIDKYRRFDETVDGFKYQTGMDGNNNPKDELVQDFNVEDSRLNRYQVPCRGGYVMIKPKVNGKFFVYLLQQGVVQWNAWEKPAANKMKWKWTPTYCIDENGQDINLKKDDGKTAVDFAYLTSSKVRSDLTADYKGKSIYAGVEDCYPDYAQFTKLSGSTDLVTNTMDAGKQAFVKDNWGTADETQPVTSIDAYYSSKNIKDKSQPGEPVLSKTGGYIIPYKGYVRYSFDGYAGKTYFFFTPGSKIGFAGYAIIPDVSHETKSVELDAKQTFDPEDLTALKNSTTGENLLEEDAKNLNVTITNKKFFRGQWIPLTLPFSMSEDQVEETFGYGTEITCLDNIKISPEAGVANINFIEHYYQHIVAGVPYFIRPTFVNKMGSDLYVDPAAHKDNTQTGGNEGTGTTTEGDDSEEETLADDQTLKTDSKGRKYMSPLTFHNVAILKQTDQLKEDVVVHDGDKKYTLRMYGLYGRTENNIPAGSFYLSGGKLYHTLSPVTSSGFSAYIADEGAKDGRERLTDAKVEMNVSWYDSADPDYTATVIEDSPIVEVPSHEAIAHPGVYNLQGMYLGKTTDGLQRGIYIANGRKVVVR